MRLLFQVSSLGIAPVEYINSHVLRKSSKLNGKIAD